MKEQSSAKKIIVITLKLLIICALVAFLVATVNYLTKDAIALNIKLNSAKALTDIYRDDEMIFSVNQAGEFEIKDENGNTKGTCLLDTQTPLLDDVDNVYIISDTNGELFGYCVEASPMGFKDKVGMMIAINKDLSVKGVEIVSLSDTKGLGDKVKDKTWLGKFVGKLPGFSDSESELSSMVISGSTRTSKPVTVAVDTALKQIKSMTKGGN